MDLLRIVVKKRTEDNTLGKDADSAGRFTSRVAKLHGEGPMSSADEPEVTLEVVSINIKDIEIPPNYTRKAPGDVTSLVESIKVYGIQQPLKVVKIKGSRKYRLVFGRRRLKAAELAGLDAVPCIVELVTREDRLQMLSLVENVQRVPLNPLEEGEAYQQMISQNTPVDELAKNMGIPLRQIQEILEFFTLPQPVRKDIMAAPDRFTFAMLKVLVHAFRMSKVHGKKLFAAIASGEVSSAADAETYVNRLSHA